VFRNEETKIEKELDFEKKKKKKSKRRIWLQRISRLWSSRSDRLVEEDRMDCWWNRIDDWRLGTRERKDGFHIARPISEKKKKKIMIMIERKEREEGRRKKLEGYEGHIQPKKTYR
jgi:hypothetical protein